MSLREELLAQGYIEQVTKGRWKTVYYEDTDGVVIAKECRKCRDMVVSTGFFKEKNGLGGVRGMCKACDRSRQLNYQKENPEKVRETRRKSREANKDWYIRYEKENKERIAERMRKWYLANREERLEYGRKQYRENRERYLEAHKKWASENKDKVSAKSKRWYLANKERHASSMKEWAKNNPDKVRLASQRRRAKKSELPNDLTHEQQLEIMTFFNNSCALTGEMIDIHLDHVIPIASGHGGTIYGNLIPLRGDLNISKSDTNLFEWFELNKQRFNLPQKRFDSLIDYLAEANGMTIEEYKTYYYSCFEGKADDNVV